MRIITFLKFGGFSLLLAFIPLVMAASFFYLHEAHTSTYLGFFVGLIIAALLFMFLLEPLFRTSIKYVNKKEKERELAKQQNTF